MKFLKLFMAGVSLSALVLTACGDPPEPARLATKPADYKRLGIEEKIQVREDGMRTDGKPGSFEWWYFDGHLDDGVKIVIAFHTKPMTEQNKELSPLVTIQLEYPDGKQINKKFTTEGKNFQASKETCAVKIGPHSFKGDLFNYEIKAKIDEVEVDLRLKNEVVPFRPATGHIFFGKNDEHFFAWLAAVPRGRISGTLTVNGKSEEVSGSGYHDHNWGNIGPHKAMHNWYWARAELGEYTMITAYITAEERFSNTVVPVFMLAKGDKIIAADALRFMKFKQEDIVTDKKTGKPVANQIASIYTDGDKRYTLSFHRKKTILSRKLTANLPFVKKTLAMLIGFDGAYHRFVGEVNLKVEEKGRLEDLKAEAIWELMYFGKSPD